ncbi:MAG: hypothetical protein ABW000_15490 [Actinoplanes sp.]
MPNPVYKSESESDEFSSGDPSVPTEKTRKTRPDKRKGNEEKTDKKSKKRMKPTDPVDYSPEAGREWTHGKLTVTLKGATPEVTNRPNQQFSAGEGMHTVPWTTVVRALKANLTVTGDPAAASQQAVDHLTKMVDHVRRSPLTRLPAPENQRLRQRSRTTETIPERAPGLLDDSLLKITDSATFITAVKDFLVYRNSLRFAAIQGYAAGGGEATYVNELTRREKALRTETGVTAPAADLEEEPEGAAEPKNTALPAAAALTTGFLLWRSLDIPALLTELDNDYTADEASQILAAVLAVAVDETSRWAPLSLAKAGLLPSTATDTTDTDHTDADAMDTDHTDTDHTDYAQRIVADFLKYLETEVVRSTVRDKEINDQQDKQYGPLDKRFARPANNAQVWRDRKTWFEGNAASVGVHLAGEAGWIGDYGFSPASFSAVKHDLNVGVTPAGNYLDVKIGGRPKSPYTNSEGSHVTAWELERQAVMRRLSGVPHTRVAETLRTMVTECESAPSLKLDKYLPEPHSATLLYLRTNGLDMLRKAVAELGNHALGTAGWIEAVEAAIAGYLHFRNALPYTTTYAGSRDSHGEAVALATLRGHLEKGTRLRNAGSVTKKLFDENSLRDELDLFGEDLTATERQKIIKTKRDEFDTQIKAVFPGVVS